MVDTESYEGKLCSAIAALLRHAGPEAIVTVRATPVGGLRLGVLPSTTGVCLEEVALLLQEMGAPPEDVDAVLKHLTPRLHARLRSADKEGA